LFLVGLTVGGFGGLFGIGGSLIAIPALSLLFGYDQQLAQGTALVMGTPNVIVGLWRYAQRPAFDRRAALIMAIFGTPGTFVGAYVALHVAGNRLRPAFAAFLVALSMWLLIRAVLRVAQAQTGVSQRKAAIGTVGFFAGTLSGTFSSGGAAFAVPILSTFFGYSQAAAQGLSLALVAPGSIIALATYALSGKVDWQAGIVLALGGSLLVKEGVALAHRLPDRTLRLCFSGLLLLTAFAIARHG
jgi:uncharacterized membrane protein YfcA